jgi:hypothetical protein
VSKIFVSWTRQREALARNFVESLQSLEHVRFDLSYLDGPSPKIDDASGVNYEEQGALLLDFQQSLPDHPANDDTRILTGDQLEMLLERAGTASKPAPSKPPALEFLCASAVPCRSSILHFENACAP